MKRAILPCVAGVALFVMAQNANAIIYDITSDHATGGLGGSGPPFGSVTLIQNGTTVDVTVHLVTGINGYSYALTGAGDNMDFKFNAVGVVLADITIDQNAPAGIGPLSAHTGTFSGDGTGLFGFGIVGDNQGPGGSDPFNTDIIFHVGSATIADLTQPNALGYVFVADLLGPNGNTGPAAATGPRTVPDGGTTMLMLGSALAGLGAIARRFKK